MRVVFRTEALELSLRLMFPSQVIFHIWKPYTKRILESNSISTTRSAARTAPKTTFSSEMLRSPQLNNINALASPLSSCPLATSGESNGPKKLSAMCFSRRCKQLFIRIRSTFGGIGVLISDWCIV